VQLRVESCPLPGGVEPLVRQEDGSPRTVARELVPFAVQRLERRPFGQTLDRRGARGMGQSQKLGEEFATRAPRTAPAAAMVTAAPLLTREPVPVPRMRGLSASAILCNSFDLTNLCNRLCAPERSTRTASDKLRHVGRRSPEKRLSWRRDRLGGKDAQRAAFSRSAWTATKSPSSGNCSSPASCPRCASSGRRAPGPRSDPNGADSPWST